MKKTIKLFFLIIFIWGLLSVFSVVNAASAEIEAKPTSVKVGEKATVTVTVNAVTCNLKVSGSATDKIVEYDKEGEKNITTTRTYTIDTTKSGTYTVSLTGDITDAETEKNTKIDKSVSITVKQEEPKEDDKNPNNGGSSENQNTNSGSNNGTTNNNSGGNNSTTNNNSGSTTTEPAAKSTNAYLSTLGVRLNASDANELGVGTDEYDFTGFKKSSLSYKVTVPYEVESLKVSHKAAHSGATVKVTGNTGFDVGSSNKITITVTAEDRKTTKTYTIKVTRLAEEEEKPGNIIDEDIEELFLTSLNIKGVEISPEFSKDVYAYTATLSKNVAEVEVNAVANKENAGIEVSGNTNLIVGENIINIVVKQSEGTSQAVYQITLTKEATAVTTIGEENNFMSSLIDNIKNYVVIAVIVVVFVIAAIITLIVLLRKENKRLKEQETEEEYNVYENDENEFEDNKVEEIVKEQEIEETTNETETKNEGRRQRRKEKGRHSK